MHIAFFGSSLVSAYWNGAATYYRGLLKALAARRHVVTFYEPDAYERQKHRDIEDPPWADVVVYRPEPDTALAAVESAKGADLVVKASGVGVLDALLEAAVLELKNSRTRVVFWDVDAAATIERVRSNDDDVFRPLIAQYDLVFTYGGGPPVVQAYQELGARSCVPIYNGLDPETHHPEAPRDELFGLLGFLGNRLPDREERVEEFFLTPARALPKETFVLGGDGWEGKAVPDNVVRVGHVHTADHNAFNCSPRLLLNVARASRARFGYSPGTRIFEAAGAGACLITDAWEGLELFLEPGREVLVAQNADGVLEHLSRLDADTAQEIGARARARMLAAHTYAHRALDVESALGGAKPHRAPRKHPKAQAGDEAPVKAAPAWDVTAREALRREVESAAPGLAASQTPTLAPAQAAPDALAAASPSGPPLDIVVLGLSLTSSWGNGHASTYRALVRSLVERGHRVLFLERDLPEHAQHRDLPRPPFGRMALYDSVADLKKRFSGAVRMADLVIVGSLVPEGSEVSEWVLRTASQVTAFYDLDTPATLAHLEAGDCRYLAPGLVPRFELYLSFTGGPTLELLERKWKAQRARALYCSFDPRLYFPAEIPTRWHFGYMGTYRDDRQPALEALLLEPARHMKEARFAVAGPKYPSELRWPQNVERIEHLAPSRHRSFYCASGFTLNVTRRERAQAGWSPSVRLFEAAACGTPIITDEWPGLEAFFTPGREILVVKGTDDVLGYLRELPKRDRVELAARARHRVLTEHTAEHRAAALEEYVRTLRAAQQPPRRAVGE
jgi:spore maturation protein CgeB